MTARVGVISKGTGGGMSMSRVSFSWELGTPRSFSYTLPLVGVLRRAAGLPAAPLLSSFRQATPSRVQGLVCTLLLRPADEMVNSLGSQELPFVSSPSVSSTVLRTLVFSERLS